MEKHQILIRLSESKHTKFGKEDFKNQSYPQKVFSAIWSLESEVNNGGFSQYFINSSAETAFFIVEALTAIGALNTAKICKKAIEEAFPESLPETDTEISKLALEFNEYTIERLDELDGEFFNYPDNLTDLLFDFVKKYPEEFGLIE